jgi:RNA recognition motif-containing protein
MNIHVSNLSEHICADDLKSLFAAYGQVLMAVVFRDPENRRAPGTAIVEMPDDGQATRAIDGLNHTLLGGEKIQLHEVRHKTRVRRN